MAVNRRQSSRNIDDHIVRKTEAVEEGTGNWDISEGEVHSDVRLEDDAGVGSAAVIRAFDFKANPEMFRNLPTKQELFDAHANQIRAFLWKDGLEAMEDMKPQLKIAKDKTGYRIVVVAVQAKGHILSSSFTPRTLSQIANDSAGNTN